MIKSPSTPLSSATLSVCNSQYSASLRRFEVKEDGQKYQDELEEQIAFQQKTLNQKLQIIQIIHATLLGTTPRCLEANPNPLELSFV